ncbi:DUF805 domain-containing protein [Metarhizobium album]|uniref:DUF805 domain-containing protein n=1 Tax=Metarhizobium album TaxID=2182425 RepID=A0A2U2DRL0_9HYPH|nr:DUF805 domain-containing protein [Rhizobium album]PWE55953.1 DUF805 domain-containing protein [Rhizobium album]
MSFTEAVSSALSKYVVFSGRASRSEYWWFVLFNIIVSIVAAGVDAALGIQAVGALVSLALLLPGIAVGVRRLHDIDKSGWWLLIAFVPLIGFIVLIYFFVQPSQPGDNRFGPPPA